MNQHNANTPTLEAQDLYKTFSGASSVDILKGLSLSILPGESIAIVGKSGSGKSSLLHILGKLDTPSKGKVFFPKAPKDLPPEKLRALYIGFVFQSFHLLEDYSLVDNVQMPGRILKKANISTNRADVLLEQVGLLDKKHSPVKCLSGGEKQRAAIARALYNDPEILLVDEPTGSLDEENASIVQRLLLDCSQKQGKSLLLVTHDAEFALMCDNVFTLKNGILTKQTKDFLCQ